MSEKRILTDEFKAFVQDIADNYKVPGLTLGVVHGGEVEFGAWGRRTEDDEPMTVDVSLSHNRCGGVWIADSRTADVVLPRFMLEGVLSNRTRTADGRLCSWTQHDGASCRPRLLHVGDEGPRSVPRRRLEARRRVGYREVEPARCLEPRVRSSKVSSFYMFTDDPFTNALRLGTTRPTTGRTVRSMLSVVSGT